MTCRNFIDNRCSIGLHGGTPSHGVCSVCDQYAGAARGLGDLVELAANLLRIKQLVGDCDRCSERRAALNAAVPFTDKPKEG